MRTRFLRFSSILAVVVAAAFLLAPAPSAHAAQISVQIGPAPICPYGYYAYPPYDCAPYGYYGPEWFSGGIFIGAGPWYHGRPDFYGHVDRHLDPHYGYHGPYPHRGEQDHWDHGHWANHPHEEFHGSDLRDGHGNEQHGHPR